MAYTPVPIDTDIARVAQQITQAKNNGTYAGNEKTWDDAVMQAVLTNVRNATRQNQASNQVTVDNAKTAKKVWDEMDALVKKKGKKLTTGDVKVLETGLRSIERCIDTAKRDSVALMAVLQGYRGGWDKTAKDLLSDPSRINEAMQLRQASIDENKRVKAVDNRMAEYQARMTSIVKTAHTLASEGANQDDGRVRDFLIALAKATKEIEDPLRTATNAYTTVAGLSPKDVPNQQIYKVRVSGVENADVLFKNARGGAKTLDLTIANFKKGAAGFEGPAKQRRDAALKDAATRQKQLAALIKNAESLETKAKKKLATLKK